MATALKNLTKFITSQEDFNGSSVTARLIEGVYTIKSYSTIIATFRRGSLVWFDDTSYSTTTSKLQHLIRANYTISELKLNAPKSHKVWIR